MKNKSFNLPKEKTAVNVKAFKRFTKKYFILLLKQYKAMAPPHLDP
jgi:hypothetical protein